MKAIHLAAFVTLAGLGLLLTAGPARAGQTTVYPPVRIEIPAKADTPAKTAPPAKADAPAKTQTEEKNPFEKEEEVAPPLADPVHGMNRAFFSFNDAAYFWVVKPVARGYKALLSEGTRVGVSNMFSNLGSPMRVGACLAAGDLKGSGTELARLGVNTTVGLLGYHDSAKSWLKIEMRDTDFGLTFAQWGMGPGWYLNWPLLGPSCGRDTLALPLNMVLNPLTFLPGAGIIQKINYTSLHIGEYEDLKRNALDPYVAIRDAYNQHRRYELKKLER